MTRVATFSTHSFTGSGTANVSLPSGQAGDLMMLFVSHNSSTAISTPSGWTLETSFRTAAPLYRSYSRTRVGGDSAVSVTVAAAGSVMVVNFPVAPADLYFGASSLPGDAGPVTLSKVNDSTSEVGFYTDAVVVAWHEHAGYIDTDGDFSEAALAAQSLVTFSAYDLADMVDMTTYTVELTDPTGIIRRADLFAFNGPPAAAWRVGRIGWGTRGAWS